MTSTEEKSQQFRLSALDLSPIVAGATAAQALRNTVELARHTERLGYTRYWLAEHHNSPGLASSTPEILISHVATATSSIRVGSGGIMLPNHSPLKVAEAFRLLEALHPGRIDLGIGRAPGTDGRTALALRRSVQALRADDFPEQLRDLLGFLFDALEPEHPFAGVRASPVGVEPPDLWMLGSSANGGSVAAQLGMGFAFAHHINPEPAVEVLRGYRANFTRSGLRDEPESILAVFAICAETDARADEVASSSDLMWVQLATGKAPSLVSIEEALLYPWSPAEETLRRANRQRHFVGSPERVREDIARLARAAQVDEIMILTNTYDEADRRRSYELLAEAFGVGV